MIYTPAQLRYRTQPQRLVGEGMVQKIALEEHFAIPETINPAHDARYASWFPAWPDIKRRLLDLKELRLPEMDKHGIELVILGLHNPAI